MILKPRNSQRFKVKDGHFVIHAKNIGMIENISLDGLCCTCINEDYFPQAENNIEIRCLNKSHRIQNLNVHILKTETTSGESIFNIFTRKCHLRFEKLTEDQKDKLINFISEYAINLS